jgi:hypothetical protein
MNKNKVEGNIKKLLSVASLILSIVALFFSWQANKFSHHDGATQVLILDTSWRDSRYHNIESGKEATCVHTIRLSNLGGTSTALTNFKANISLEQSELTVENSFGGKVTRDQLTPRIGFFQIYLFPNETQIDISSPLNSNGILEFPYAIEPFSTVDIQVGISFRYDFVVSLESPLYKEPNSFYYDPSKLEGYAPMMVSYTFKMATGEEAKSPSVACWYVN